MACFQEGSEFDILLYQTSNHQILISNHLIGWCIKLSNHQNLMIWWIKFYQKTDVMDQIWWIKTDATHQKSVVSNGNCYNRPSNDLMIWWIKYLILISKSNWWIKYLMIWCINPSNIWCVISKYQIWWIKHLILISKSNLILISKSNNLMM